MQRGKIKNRLLDYWLGIPLLNFAATLMRMGRYREWPRNIQRIGLICSPALGDTLLFSAVALDVQRQYPDAELIHFCMKQNLAAAELIPWEARRVIVNLTEPPECIRRIRSERIDLLLDFTSWQRLTAFYTLMSGARFTVGFQSAGQRRSRGYDLAIEHRADRHEVDNFRALLHSLNIAVGSRPAVALSPLLEEPFSRQHDIVVFHPWASGTRSWLREWPEEYWIALAKQITGSGTLFVVTGAPSDMARAEPFVERLRATGIEATTFAGTDGFNPLAHLLKRARVVVSVNTGVMHLAAIVGARTISINGPNRNGRWGPIGPYAIGVEAPGNGCGYLHLGFEFDGRPSDCMERITPEMIASALRRVEVPSYTSLPQ
jgi:ADP-heptose:LPS heptosyltransferase